MAAQSTFRVREEHGHLNYGQTHTQDRGAGARATQDADTAADEPMPSVEERPTVDDGTLIVLSCPMTTTSYICNTTATHVINRVEGILVESCSQLVKPPEPFHYGGTEGRPQSSFLERVACCHCSALCLEGQRVCFECGGPVKKSSVKSQNRERL